MTKNNTLNYDKPFKTYDELLDILESRNVIISDKSFAKQCLSDISYYNLINGYKDLFSLNNDQFLSPVPFHEFYMLYTFDTFLNNIFFKYIIMIEKALKSKLSYIVSENYGVETTLSNLDLANPDDYLCKENYQNTAKRNNILKKIKKTTFESKNESIIHYKTNHNHIPCWILTNGIPFGLAIEWYRILKPNEKDYICNQLLQTNNLTLEEKKEFLINSLIILRKYRNNIAHGNKIFINSISEELPKKQVLTLTNGLISNSDYIQGIGKNDIFAVIIIIYFLINKNYRTTFIVEVIGTFSMFKKNYFSSNKTLLEMLALPNDFIDKLNQLKNL